MLEQSLQAAIDRAAIVAIANGRGTITYVNDKFCEISQYSREELIGKTAQIISADYYEKAFFREMRSAIKKRKVWQGEIKSKAKDGTYYWVDTTIVRFFNQKVKTFQYLAIQFDITNRKQAELALRQQLERERLTIAIAQRIRESLDLEAILNTTVAEVQQLLAADRVLVYRVWPNGTGSAIAEAVAPSWTKVLNIVFPEEVFPKEIYHQYVAGKIYALADRENGQVLPCLVEFLKSLQVKAKLVVPILQQGTLWGLLIAHQCSEPREWQSWEMELLRQLATQLAIAIQQSQLYNQLQVELTDRKQAQKALQQAKDQLQAVLDTVPGLVSWISSDLYYLGVNQNLAAAFHLPPEKIVGQKVGFLESEAEFAEFLSQFFANSTKTDSKIINFSINKESRSFLIVAQKYQQGFACVSVGIDITDRQKAEEKIKASLREKEVLLKEIHHRVKNNLYVVYSLLEMQADSILERGISRLFEDSQNRIYSMALIHDKLYRSQNLAQINFGDYLEDLVTNLFDSYNVNKERITLYINAAPISLNIETAAPCGLIVNELVSNIMKHAFPDDRAGIISVKCYQDWAGKIHLIVKDDGIGFPDNINFRNTNSMGFQVVCTLTEQLEGKIELVKDCGTVFHLQFTELSYRKRL